MCVGEESTLKGTQTCNFQIKYIFMTSVRVFFELTSYSKAQFLSYSFTLFATLLHTDEENIQKHNTIVHTSSWLIMKIETNVNELKREWWRFREPSLFDGSPFNPCNLLVRVSTATTLLRFLKVFASWRCVICIISGEQTLEWICPAPNNNCVINRQKPFWTDLQRDETNRRQSWREQRIVIN